MMKVSILTPVYNTASYLPQCIESVLAQSYADWQLICVDDCSTDNSYEIIQRYAAADSRIVALHNDRNVGLAAARNRALHYATGEIITMLDSDDWISADAFQKIVDEFEADADVDCVLYDMIMHYSDHDEREFVNAVSHTQTGYEAFRLSIDWRIHGVYAARRSLYERHPYDDSRRSHTDENTTRFHYLDSRKVAFSTARYYYRQHLESCTHVFGLQRFNMLPALEILYDQLAADPRVAPSDLHTLNTYRWHHIQGAYMLYYARRSDFSESDRRAAKRMLAQYYENVDTSHLPWRERLRFGYAPLKWCPPLYRLQMLAFTRIRRLVGLDRHRYD